MSNPTKPAHQKISFVTAKDGTRIAVARMGKGPTILKAGNWLSHATHDGESPIWRHWLQELSRDHQFIRYDLRGCGLSDRDVEDISFDAWLSDLEAVADTIDGPVTLLGLSQGCALSIAFALRHPEKVERLILIGSYAQGMLARGNATNAQLEADTPRNSDTDISYDLQSADLRQEGDQRCRNANNMLPSSRRRSRWKP